MKAITRLTVFVVLMGAGMFYLTGCGGGGGTATPDDIANSVINATKNMDFKRYYSLTPEWAKRSGEGLTKQGGWRIGEGWVLWKDRKKWVEEMDPENKAEVDTDEKYKKAGADTMYGLRLGAYKLYKVDKMEDRVKKGDWVLLSRTVNYGLEGTGGATFTFTNGWGTEQAMDRIVVHCDRENGVWFLDRIEFHIPKELAKKPE